MTVERIVERPEQSSGVRDRGEPRDLLRPHNLGIEPHVAVLGALRLEEVEAVRVRCEGEPAHVVEPARLAGELLQLAVEPDGVALERRHVGVGVQGVEAARGVPGRAGGELGALDKHRVAPAEPGEVIEHAAPDHPAADHRHPHMGLHDCSRPVCFRQPRGRAPRPWVRTAAPPGISRSLGRLRPARTEVQPDMLTLPCRWVPLPGRGKAASGPARTSIVRLGVSVPPLVPKQRRRTMFGPSRRCRWRRAGVGSTGARHHRHAPSRRGAWRGSPRSGQARPAPRRPASASSGCPCGREVLRRSKPISLRLDGSRACGAPCAHRIPPMACASVSMWDTRVVAKCRSDRHRASGRNRPDGRPRCRLDSWFGMAV